MNFEWNAHVEQDGALLLVALMIANVRCVAPPRAGLSSSKENIYHSGPPLSHSGDLVLISNRVTLNISLEDIIRYKMHEYAGHKLKFYRRARFAKWNSLLPLLIEARQHWRFELPYQHTCFRSTSTYTWQMILCRSLRTWHHTPHYIGFQNQFLVW